MSAGGDVPSIDGGVIVEKEIGEDHEPKCAGEDNHSFQHSSLQKEYTCLFPIRASFQERMVSSPTNEPHETFPQYVYDACGGETDR